MAIKARASITISRIVDISTVTRYYKLQSSTTLVPSKPTTNPPSGWTTTEPSYSSGSTDTLYFVDCTVMTNGTFSYSEVSKSSSYEAAKEAYNKAANCEVAIEQNRSAIEIRATKNEVLDAVAKASNDLENTISDEYVNKNNYATDKDTTSKRIEGVEKTAENNTKAISDSTKSADDKISNLSKTLSKYFKFDTNGLTIGSGENSLKLVLDNNEIGFFKNNQKIAWWDGNYLHTGNIEVATNERAQFGNFAFIPRSDGSLMFLKVSDMEVSG